MSRAKASTSRGGHSFRSAAKPARSTGKHDERPAKPAHEPASGTRQRAAKPAEGATPPRTEGPREAAGASPEPGPTPQGAHAPAGGTLRCGDAYLGEDILRMFSGLDAVRDNLGAVEANFTTQPASARVSLAEVREGVWFLEGIACEMTARMVGLGASTGATALARALVNAMPAMKQRIEQGHGSPAPKPAEAFVPAPELLTQDNLDPELRATRYERRRELMELEVDGYGVQKPGGGTPLAGVLASVFCADDFVEGVLGEAYGQLDSLHALVDTKGDHAPGAEHIHDRLHMAQRLIIAALELYDRATAPAPATSPG